MDGHFTLSFSQQLAVAVKDIRQFLCLPPGAEMSDHGEDAALRLEPSSFNAGMLCAMCGLLTFAADEVGCRVKEVCGMQYAYPCTFCWDGKDQCHSESVCQVCWKRLVWLVLVVVMEKKTALSSSSSCVFILFLGGGRRLASFLCLVWCQETIVRETFFLLLMFLHLYSLFFSQKIRLCTSVVFNNWDIFSSCVVERVVQNDCE